MNFHQVGLPERNEQRLFDSSVTFHCPCHHTKRQQVLLNSVMLCLLSQTKSQRTQNPRLPDTQRACVQVTQLNTLAQLQEQATTGRLANEFQFMFTHQVLIQTFPPATAAGDTSGPITAAACFPLRAHSDLACTSSRKHSCDSWNHCSYRKDRAFRQLRQHFCTNPLRKVSFQISQLQKPTHTCIHTLLY